MSTRGYIGYYDPKRDRYVGSYCHFGIDNLPEYLLKYYNTFELAKKLVDGGDMSYVGKEIGHKHDFNKPNWNWTLYYHRDRGEPWEATKPKTFLSIIDFADFATRYNVVYVFAGGSWHYLFNKSLVPIETAKSIEEVAEDDRNRQSQGIG
ncbi:MAG: hypothetical protein GXO10_04965 [Crenarchaeota archaeon]|nr:hypothetical protein [Thermoproteota archaeon]